LPTFQKVCRKNSGSYICNLYE